MAKTPKQPKGNKPVKNPCGTCGRPLSEHTVSQIADCLASRN